MFAKYLIAPLFIATTVVAVPTFVRRGDVSLSDWSSQNLESYWKFKMRYRSLDCAAQNGTDFYTTCCCPLSASESLSSRPAECTPTTCAATTPSTDTVQSTTTSDAASVATPSASEYVNEEDLPYCDDGDDDTGEYSSADGNGDTSTSESTPTTPTDNNGPTPTDNSNPTPTDNNNPNPTYNNDPAPSSSQDNSQPTTTQAQDNSGSTGGDVNRGGFATYYTQDGNAGACGDYHGDGDLIAAIDIERYGYDTGVKSALCGRRVRITNTNNQATVDVTIADVCPTCVNGNSIDLSVGAFTTIATENEGQVPIEWYFI